MSDCCGKQPEGAGRGWFDRMIPNCLAHAKALQEAGRPVVGILCEFTPREIVLAAGGVPVCLCGGSRDTIAAAEEMLPSNLCPLIKSTFGYAVARSNPFLEMADLVVAETTCDGKKKMFELLAERKPMHVLELPQKQDEPGALGRWRAELDRLVAVLQERFSVDITEERLRSASAAMNHERDVRRRLAALMERDAPPLTGLRLLGLKSSISCIPGAQEEFERVLEELTNAPGLAGAESRTRVLLTGVPTVAGAEKVVRILEASGGLVVAQENCTGLKPIMEDVALDGGDIMDAIAAKYLHLPCSIMTPNRGRLDSLRELAARTRPACVVDLVWQACLTYDVESYRVKRFVEEELHLPYLKIETDYSPSDAARIAVRVEALYEMTRGRA